MKRLILIVSAVCMAVVMQAGTVNYIADNSTIFSNPERGFITMLTRHLSESKPYAVKGKEDVLEEKKANEQMSIVLLHYYLDNYKTTEVLPSVVLNGFDEDMQVLRNLGMKAIVRFSYVDGTYGKGKKESAEDASLEIVQKHLAQYASHWQANADVIFCFQAGIIGAWGEWYYSDHFGNQSSHMNASRSALLDTLLQAVPQDRCIQIRTPLFKTEYLGSTDPLTEEEAYQGTPKARLGHHNDAFLYHYDNMGTYRDTATQKPYIAQETLYVPIGGESDITEPEQAEEEASYEATIAEMSRLHWTFIQSGYSEVVTNMWRENGTFDELNRRMGYRYQLVSGTYSDTVVQGGEMAVKMQIRNVGFAPLYNARPVYLVFSDQQSVFRVQINTDPRRWKPNGATTEISETFTIPEELPEGKYRIYLYMPDGYASLSEDPRYAVRFANEGVWDSESGMNALLAEVEIIQPSGGEDPTGNEKVTQKPSATKSAKTLRNGQVLIECERTTYNMLGSEQK